MDVICVFGFRWLLDERPDTRRSDDKALAATKWSGSLMLLFAKKMPPRLHAEAYEKRPWKCSDFWHPAHLLLGNAHTSFPPSPPPKRRLASRERWEFVSSHSSATASDSHGVPSHGHCFKARKELRAPCARHALLRQAKNPLSVKKFRPLTTLPTLAVLMYLSHPKHFRRCHWRATSSMWE